MERPLAITLHDFLVARKFTTDPFATTNAEQEREHLASYFVRVSWFDRLVGEASQEQKARGTRQQQKSLILFAPRGYGKTSHRMEVARAIEERRNQSLIVTFTDFDLLLQDAPGPADLNAYLPLICQGTLESLDDFLQQHPRLEQTFCEQKSLFARFGALLRLFAPLRLLDRGISLDNSEVNALVQAFQETRLGARKSLQELARLVEHAGCEGIVVLIDGVDELSTTKDNAEAALNLLSPLLDAPGFLQESGFAFKFFLPDFLEPPMREQGVGRLDRIPVYHLEWSNEELRKMLAKRMEKHSLRSPTGPAHVRSFRDLCKGNQDADRMLVEKAAGSPRRLIDLARQVVEAHCRATHDPSERISPHTLEQVVCSPDAQAVSAMPSLSPSAPEQQPHSTRVPWLFFDERGDVWVGERRCNKKPLPKYLRHCMDYLWQNRHRTIAYDELQEALYGDTLEDRGDPRSSVDKIVRRLRAVMEPGSSSSPTYITVQPGQGYVLNNFREPEP